MADGDNQDDTVRLIPNKRAKSDVWKHFKLREVAGKVTENLAVCVLCNAEVKYAGGTTNLTSHVRRHHPGTHNGQTDLTAKTNKRKADIDAVDTNLSELQTSSATIARQQQTLPSFIGANYPSHSQRAKLLTHKIACFIIKDLRPYSMVDSPEFRDLIKAMDPRYVVPGRKQFAEVIIPRLYCEIKEKVITELKVAEQIAITTDGWTSRATESYITITSCHIDRQWQMRNFVLQTRILSESHTGENLAKVLTEAFKEWGISGEPVPPIVTDNASNIVKAGELLGCKLHFKCFAHTLNLAAQKCLKTKSVSRLLSRIRHIVSFFRRSTTATALMLNQAELLSLPRHKLKIDVCTRWNSTYDMLCRFLEMQCAIVATTSIHFKQLNRDKDLYNLTDEEITLAEDLMACLQPIKSITTTMCDEKHPTLSMIVPLKHKLLSQDMVIQENDSSTVKEVKKIIKTDLQDRYSSQEDILLLVTCLDPRFKTLPFLSEEERYKVFTHVVEQTASLSPRPVQVKLEPGSESSDKSEAVNVPRLPSLSENDTVPKEKKLKVETQSTHNAKQKLSLQDILGDVYITKVEKGVPQKSTLEETEDQVKRYRDMSPIPLSGDPLQWWKENEANFPGVARLAKKMLCIPGTSVPSERVFSTSGDIITASRASLKPEHLDKLLFLKKNL